MHRYLWLLSLLASPVLAGEHTYYLHVVNDTADGIRSLSVAQPGKADAQAVPVVMEALHGGGDSTALRFRVASGDCLRDLRWTFETGAVFVQHNFDVCHDQRYRINSATKQPNGATLTQR